MLLPEYKNETALHFKVTMKLLSQYWAEEITGDSEVEIKFSNRIKRKLGYCVKRTRTITYNWDWCWSNRHNKELISYLVIHECCHLKHPNHGPWFELEMKKIKGYPKHICDLPEWENAVQICHSYEAKCSGCGQTHKAWSKPRKDGCCACIGYYDPLRKLIYKRVR